MSKRMSTTTPQDIADYLVSLKSDVSNIAPSYLSIRRKAYPCVFYTETLQTNPSTRAYREGARTYTREMCYVVGMLPSVRVRGNIAFNMWHFRKYDGRDWFVAAYYGNVVNRKQELAPPSEFHPFGNSFILAPWDVTEGDKIDQYARVPYLRVPAYVTDYVTDYLPQLNFDGF